MHWGSRVSMVAKAVVQIGGGIIKNRSAILFVVLIKLKVFFKSSFLIT